MGNNSTAKLLVLSALVVVAYFAWDWRLHRAGSGGQSAAAARGGTAQGGATAGGAAGAAAQPARDFKRDAPMIWSENHPDPPPVDLLVLPLNDRTGLKGNQNYEIGDFSNRLLQTWMALAGKPVTCADHWAVQGTLTRRKLNSTAFAVLGTTVAADIGRALKAGRVVQVETLREGTSLTVARARAVDPATGRVIGEWSAAIEEPKPTYESLFDAQALLAPKVAAALSGLGGPEALISRVRAAVPAAGDDAEVQRTLSAARAAFVVASQPRCMEAMRLALGVAEKYPGVTDAWVMLAAANATLAGQFEPTETGVWRDAMLRSMVAGEVAYAVNPSDPYARYARTYGMCGGGRWAQAMRIAREDATAHPDEFITSMSCANLWHRADEYPPPSLATTPARPRVSGNLPAGDGRGARPERRTWRSATGS